MPSASCEGIRHIKIRAHRELKVYKRAFAAAMEIFATCKRFPPEERYSLTDQIQRAFRSVCTNIAEAWRKRRYEAAFISKLPDAEAEAAATQVWLEFAVKCTYMEREAALGLYREYDRILRTLVGMINNPQSWIIAPT